MKFDQIREHRNELKYAVIEYAAILAAVGAAAIVSSGSEANQEPDTTAPTEAIEQSGSLESQDQPVDFTIED